MGSATVTADSLSAGNGRSYRAPPSAPSVPIRHHAVPIDLRASEPRTELLCCKTNAPPKGARTPFLRSSARLSGVVDGFVSKEWLWNCRSCDGTDLMPARAYVVASTVDCASPRTCGLRHRFRHELDRRMYRCTDLHGRVLLRGQAGSARADQGNGRGSNPPCRHLTPKLKPPALPPAEPQSMVRPAHT